MSLLKILSTDGIAFGYGRDVQLASSSYAAWTLTSTDTTVTIAIVGPPGSGSGVTGTGADKQVAYWTAASALSGESDLYYDYTTNRLGIGTAGVPLTTLHAQASDAATATVTDVLTLTHLTSGAAAAAYGAGIVFAGEDAGGGADDMARIAAVWDNAAAAAEGSNIEFHTRYSGGALGLTWLMSRDSGGSSNLLSPAGGIAFYGTGSSYTIASGVNDFCGFNSDARPGVKQVIFYNYGVQAIRFTALNSNAIQDAHFAGNVTIADSVAAWSVPGANLDIIPPAQSSAHIPLLRLVGPAHTAIGASSEYIAEDHDHDATLTWATGGTVTTQRTVVFRAPTLASAGTTTVTDAATVYITGAPATVANGGGMTITRSYAFWVDTGIARFDGQVNLGLASSQTGSLAFFSSSASYQTRLLAGTPTAAVDYTLPVAAPAANGYALTATTGGVMSWTAATSMWVAKLGTQHNNATVTATEITDLSTTLAAGTYTFKYSLICQSSATGTGIRFGVNYTGTASPFIAQMTYTSAIISGGGALVSAGSVPGIDVSKYVGASFTVTESTATPNMGTTATQAADANFLVIVEGVLVVSDGGDLELWHSSETAATTSVMVGSAVVITKIA